MVGVAAAFRRQQRLLRISSDSVMARADISDQAGDIYEIECVRSARLTRTTMGYARGRHVDTNHGLASRLPPAPTPCATAISASAAAEKVSIKHRAASTTGYVEGLIDREQRSSVWGREMAALAFARCC